MFFLHILILYHLLEEVIFTLYYLYTTTNLVSKLARYGLIISGHTQDRMYKRGAGIAAYLEEHPEIKEYVILDDCRFDFQSYPKLWERLLLTEGIEHARFAAGTPAVETMVFLNYVKLF